jgi:hypothetical protein
MPINKNCVSKFIKKYLVNIILQLSRQISKRCVKFIIKKSWQAGCYVKTEP